MDYRLQVVLDVTDGDVQRALGTGIDELCAPWRSANAASQVTPTQLLGEVVHAHAAIEALRVPSARDSSTENLVVLPDRLHDGSSLRVFDDSGLIDAHVP